MNALGILTILITLTTAQVYALGSAPPAGGNSGGGGDVGGGDAGGGDDTGVLINAKTDISAIAAASSCATYNWKNRGRAPSAYMKGMALVFAKSLCRQRAGQAVSGVIAQKNRNNTTYDAITHYESIFDTRGLEIDRSGADTLRSVFTLGIGLGMRESSGKYCEGYDTTAGSQTSSTAEAGMFQFSYNSRSANGELPKLITAYTNDSTGCMTDVFSKNVSCRSQSIIGSGAGADFQRLAKSCPAFAAEYAMITLRTLRKHYGPINRREAEVVNTCNLMLDKVQDYVEAKPAAVCEQLL
jgi:hypothetical protein